MNVSALPFCGAEPWRYPKNEVSIRTRTPCLLSTDITAQHINVVALFYLPLSRNPTKIQPKVDTSKTHTAHNGPEKKQGASRSSAEGCRRTSKRRRRRRRCRRRFAGNREEVEQQTKATPAWAAVA